MWGRLIRADDAEERAYKSSERLKDAADAARRATLPGADYIIDELFPAKKVWGIEIGSGGGVTNRRYCILVTIIAVISC